MDKYKQLLREEINLLTQWINESKAGGWSTHLVQPMQDRKNKLLNLLHAEGGI